MTSMPYKRKSAEPGETDTTPYIRKVWCGDRTPWHMDTSCIRCDELGLRRYERERTERLTKTLTEGVWWAACQLAQIENFIQFAPKSWIYSVKNTFDREES